VVGYGGQDASVEIRLSADRDEIAVFDLTGRRRACEARLTAERRVELAAALARMADAAQRSEYSDAPAKVEADGGGRVDVAALPPAVAIYVFRPGAWASRSVRLAPGDARRLGFDLEQDSARGRFLSSS
jgi:ABC-type amino acid transport substrate-binding protein